MVSEHLQSLGVSRLDSIIEEINRKHELVISMLIELVEGKSASKEEQQKDEDSVLCYGSNSAEICERFAEDTTKKSRGITIDVEGEELGTSVEETEIADEEAEEEDMEISERAGKEYGVREDCYSAVVGLQWDSKQAFFGVLDRHEGAGATEFAAKNLDRNIMNKVAKRIQEDDMNKEYATLHYLLNPRVVKRIRQIERISFIQKDIQILNFEDNVCLRGRDVIIPLCSPTHSTHHLTTHPQPMHSRIFCSLLYKFSTWSEEKGVENC